MFSFSDSIDTRKVKISAKSDDIVRWLIYFPLESTSLEVTFTLGEKEPPTEAVKITVRGTTNIHLAFAVSFYYKSCDIFVSASLVYFLRKSCCSVGTLLYINYVFMLT